MAAAPKEEPERTVLIVEDEFVIALDLSETVRDLGYMVEGPYADLESAFIALDRSRPDCAILDVRTSDGDVFPLADALTEMGVPIIFHSGHLSPEQMNERYPGSHLCRKPCPPGQLRVRLRDAMERSGALD